MFKKSRSSLRLEASVRTILAILSVAVMATAQVVAQDDSAKVGVGLAFLADNPIGQLTGTSTVYIPIATGRSFRLEPTLGWHHSSVQLSSSDPTNPANGVTESASALLLGTGLFGIRRVGSGTLLYYGPRIGIAFGRIQDTDQSGNSLKQSETDWFAAATVGGEHRISHLSVGGEVDLAYLHLGTPSFEQSGTATFLDTGVGGSTVGTGASAFVRWYF